MKCAATPRTRITRFRDGSEVIESRGGWTLVEAQQPYRVARHAGLRKRKPAKRRRVRTAKEAMHRKRAVIR